MKHYTITSSREVNQEQVDDVLTTALEGGITYWCDKVTTTTDLGDKYLSEMLTRGATLEFHDAEEDKWHQLSIGMFLDALGYRALDFDNYDASDADSVVQQALFGEVIYG